MWLNVYKEDKNSNSVNKLLDEIKSLYSKGAEYKKDFFPNFNKIVLAIPDIEILVFEKDLDLYRLFGLYENIVWNFTLSEKQIRDTLLYNYNFDFWDFIPQFPDGFFIKKDEERIHPESSNQLSINFKDKNNPEWWTVATVNFFFVVYSADNIELRINNIQGALKSREPQSIKNPEGGRRIRLESEKWKRLVQRIYSKLNSGLKENWQTHIVQEICEQYKETYKVVGDMPAYYGWFDSTRDGYLKYLFGYLECFLAWWIDVNNIDVRSVVPQFQKPIKTILKTISKFPPENQIRFVKLLKKKYISYMKKLNIESEKFDDSSSQKKFIKESLLSALRFENHPQTLPEKTTKVCKNIKRKIHAICK